MAFHENQVQGGKSSTFADDGTASHHWAALCLQQGIKDAEFFLTAELQYNDKIYTMDEERAGFVQVYLDDVRRRALGGILFVEHRIDLGNMSGTADAAIYLPATKHLIVEDLKYGMGEKVSAQIDGKINPQLGLYLLGMLKDIELLGHSVETLTGVICQPRVEVIDEHTLTIDELEDFARKAELATEHAGRAMIESDFSAYLSPGEKQCRWCRAKTQCPALAKLVQDEVRCDFDTIAAENVTIPNDTKQLAKAYGAVPLIQDWCRAVEAEVSKLVAEGKEVMGPDGKGYKFVEGKEGSRKWTDEKAVEAALVGQLGPKAYTEPKLLTAPAASKLLDKKATKQVWKDVFEPMIERPRGRPILTQGSDPRPPYAGVAGAEDFDDALQE